MTFEYWTIRLAPLALILMIIGGAVLAAIAIHLTQYKTCAEQGLVNLGFGVIAKCEVKK